MTSKEKNEFQKEILGKLKTNPHGRLILAPRSGKTKLIIDLIKRDKPESILWVTPSARLAEKDIPNEFVKWKAKGYLNRLTTVTWKSLHLIEGNYSLIVFDEEQKVTENNLVNFFNGKITGTNIVSMTGTESKSQIKKDLYKRLNLKILYRLNISDAVDLGILSNYKVKVVRVELGTANNVKAGSKKKPFLTSELKQYKYLSKCIAIEMEKPTGKIMFKIFNRMRFIKNAATKTRAAKVLLRKLKGRKLIFSGSQAQASLLSENVFHSKTNDLALQKFNQKKIDNIALVDSGGIGFTFEELDHLVVTQIDSDNNGNTTQKIARSLLQQKDYDASVWILVLKGTQDEEWLRSALEHFSEDKIEYIEYKDL